MNKNVAKLIISILCLIVLGFNYLFNASGEQIYISNIVENGSYTSKADVANYIFAYKKLPQNFITKKQALELGWEPNRGNLWSVAPGKSIGGDKFGNFEGLLPKAQGRRYIEADIDYNGGKRGSKRIVFSNDGLIFYTADHYKNFKEIKR